MMKTIALFLLLPPMVASMQDASAQPAPAVQFKTEAEAKKLGYVVNPPQKGANVTIASEFLGPSADWSFVQANHLAYAKRHNLNYFAPLEPFNWHGLGQSTVYFAKFSIIQFLFDSGADAVFWMDGDSAFVNVDQDIRGFLGEAPSKDLIVSGDQNVFFNTGHFMMRKSEWSINLLRTANSLYPCPPPWHDNCALLAALGGADPSNQRTWKPSEERLIGRSVSAEEAHRANQHLDGKVSQHFLILSQDAMNSYGDSVAGHTFIRHVAGLKRQDKISALKSITASVDWHKQKSSSPPSTSASALLRESMSVGQKQTPEPSAGTEKSPMKKMLMRGEPKQKVWAPVPRKGELVQHLN